MLFDRNLFRLMRPLPEEMARCDAVREQDPAKFAEMMQTGKRLVELAREGDINTLMSVVSEGSKKGLLMHWFTLKMFKEAANANHYPVVRYMAEMGLDLKFVGLADTLHSMIEACDPEATDSLHDTIEFLLMKGLDVNRQRSGDLLSAMHVACCRNLPSLVAFLVTKDADVNIVAAGDIMPLHCAEYGKAAGFSEDELLSPCRPLDRARGPLVALLEGRSARRSWRVGIRMSVQERWNSQLGQNSGNGSGKIGKSSGSAAVGEPEEGGDDDVPVLTTSEITAGARSVSFAVDSAGVAGCSAEVAAEVESGGSGAVRPAYEALGDDGETVKYCSFSFSTLDLDGGSSLCGGNDGVGGVGGTGGSGSGGMSGMMAAAMGCGGGGAGGGGGGSSSFSSGGGGGGGGGGVAFDTGGGGSVDDGRSMMEKYGMTAFNGESSAHMNRDDSGGGGAGFSVDTGGGMSFDTGGCGGEEGGETEGQAEAVGASVSTATRTSAGAGLSDSSAFTFDTDDSTPVSGAQNGGFSFDTGGGMSFDTGS
jgi:hypothetical protein